MSRVTFSPEDQARIEASCAYLQADVGPISDEVAATLPLFVWDTDRLRAYPSPVRRVPVFKLAYFLNAPVWRREGDYPFSLSPAEVAERPGEHAWHYEHTLKVELEYPIEMICYETGWRLADGYHRLLKATIIDAPDILVHEIPERAIPMILADLTALPPPRGGRIYA